MAELVEHFSQFRELEKPITYLRNGLGDWYTCLLYPGMEPTNNLSEQVIREHVLMRKIIGTFRSEKVRSITLHRFPRRNMAIARNGHLRAAKVTRTRALSTVS